MPDFNSVRDSLTPEQRAAFDEVETSVRNASYAEAPRQAAILAISILASSCSNPALARDIARNAMDLYRWGTLLGVLETLDQLRAKHPDKPIQQLALRMIRDIAQMSHDKVGPALGQMSNLMGEFLEEPTNDEH